MTSESVLLIGLTPDEVRQVEDLIARYDAEEVQLECVALAAMEDAEPFFSRDDVRLMILHLDESRKRPDQDIRRLKRSFSHSVPLLLLIPPDLTAKVKALRRAGADEYWILPLDSKAFPPRLYVLVEWSKAGEEETRTAQRERLAEAKQIPLWQRLKGRIRRLLAPPETRPAMPVESYSPLIAGKWRKIRRLGFGSFGEVWLVKHEEKETLAVAKVPHEQKMNSRFLREAAILKQLSGHSNAVQFKAVVKEGGKVILIQEYVEGSTLQELFSQGMDSAAKEKAFLQLLDVVSAGHKKNIMHRDIKPENIIINSSGDLKLLDYGTGKDLVRRSISSTVIGSRPYMAPEQILGKSRLASDVWALGVILYAMATECLPFYDENEKQLMDLILEVEPERPSNLEPDLPPELESILLKSLRKDWRERYANAVELRDDLLQKFPRFGEGNVLPQS